MKFYLPLVLILICAVPALADNYLVITPQSQQHKAEATPEKAPTQRPVNVPKTSDLVRPLYFFSDYGLTTGARLLANGKYAAAISDFENVLERNPRNIDALAGIGAAYLGLNQTKPAGDHIRKALARDNKHIGANYLYGRYYLQTGEIEQAIDQMLILDMLCGQKYKCPEAASLEAEINAHKK